MLEMPRRTYLTDSLAATALLVLLSAGCSARRIDQTLPTIERAVSPLPSVQIAPADSAGGAEIKDGLFPTDLGDDAPIDRLSAVIEAAFEESGAFEVYRLPPAAAETDAQYLVVFKVVEMSSEGTKFGAFMKVMDVEKNEYATVVLAYQLYNNASRDKIGPERQIVDEYRIKHSETRVLRNLGMRSYFDGADDDMRVHVNNTIRAVVRLVEDVQERVRTVEKKNASGRAGSR